MKKHYFAPELNIITLDINDVITHSLATSDGDNIIDFGSYWGNEDNYYTPWGTA